MQIDFLADAPAYRDANLTVVFAALVDGEPVPCAISVEALEDHFSVKSCDRAGWISAFDASRSQRIFASACVSSWRREMRDCTSGLNVWMPISKCNAPGGKRMMVCFNRSGK